jgi:hypothetical protein
MIEALTNSKNHIMLKKILKLDGAQELTRSEQKTIHGGLACRPDGSCPAGSKCVSDCRFTDLCRLNSYVEC